MLNVDETFNMAQVLCTSALAASYVNRLNVFFLYLKDRLYFLHLTSYFFCDSPNRIQFPTLALTDIRGEPCQAVPELRRDRC